MIKIRTLSLFYLLILGNYLLLWASENNDTLNSVNQETFHAKNVDSNDSIYSRNSLKNNSLSYLTSDSNSRVETKKYKYPPGYMRREPVINYPELDLSKCGSSLKLPTANSLNERGQIINYWHSSKVEDLKYQNDEKPEKKK